MSDEPYREIMFDGAAQAYPAKFYDNTLTCYSFSKSLSLPGERIGYVAVNPRATDADVLVPMFAQISSAAPSFVCEGQVRKASSACASQSACALRL